MPQRRRKRKKARATAFIGLDYINDIVHPEGKISHIAEPAAERGIIAKVNRALEIARNKEWLTILVKVGFSKGYLDHPKRSPFFGKLHEIGALEAGSSGMDFHPEIREDLADLVIVKPRISAFYGTQLDAALRARNVNRLVIAGVSTAWAVQSTVIWSAASVITGDVTSGRQKMRDRMVGALIGVPAGMSAGALIPHSVFAYDLSALAAVLTLVAIQPYVLAFGLRCTAVALALMLAGQSSGMAEERASHVIIGGLIGFTVMYAVRVVAVKVRCAARSFQM